MFLQVLWYVPNCIGYLRCALLVAALHLGPAAAGRCYACLCANLALDAVDGWAARALDQVHSPRMHLEDGHLNALWRSMPPTPAGFTLHSQTYCRAADRHLTALARDPARSRQAAA